MTDYSESETGIFTLATEDGTERFTLSSSNSGAGAGKLKIGSSGFTPGSGDIYVTDGEMHKIEFIIDSVTGNYTVYVDSSIDYTSTTTLDMSTPRSLTIGAMRITAEGTAYQHFMGIIADVVVEVDDVVVVDLPLDAEIPENGVIPNNAFGNTGALEYALAYNLTSADNELFTLDEGINPPQWVSSDGSIIIPVPALLVKLPRYFTTLDSSAAQYYELPATLNIVGDFAVSFLAYYPSTSDTFSMSCGAGSVSYIAVGYAGFIQANIGGVTIKSANSVFSRDTLNLVCVTRSGSAVTVYLNDVIVATGTASGNFQISKICSWDSLSLFTTGITADFKIWEGTADTSTPPTYSWALDSDGSTGVEVPETGSITLTCVNMPTTDSALYTYDSGKWEGQDLVTWESNVEAGMTGWSFDGVLHKFASDTSEYTLSAAVPIGDIKVVYEKANHTNGGPSLKIGTSNWYASFMATSDPDGVYEFTRFNDTYGHPLKIIGNTALFDLVSFSAKHIIEDAS
jgi:hypothetical protein